MENKVDKFAGDLDTVQTKVDMAMQSIGLVQQEQVQVAKLLSTGAAGSAARVPEGVMGPFPSNGTANPSVAASTSVPPPSPPPPSSTLHRQVNPNTLQSDAVQGESRKQWMPKMDFPQFSGDDARIWVDKCESYFAMYQIPASFRVSASSLHMSGSAAHWFQSYKHFRDFLSWESFTSAVVKEFEVDTHRAKVMDLLNLRQTGSVEDYRHQFEPLVYHITLYEQSLSETVLTSQFLLGLKEELRQHVQMLLPESVAKTVVLASIQEQLLATAKKTPKLCSGKVVSSTPKQDLRTPTTQSDLWQTKQLKEYRRQNGLCFKCGEKFIPGHKCAANAVATPAAHLTALSAEGADGGAILSDAILDMLEADLLFEGDQDCYISLNAISGTQTNRAIHLRALVGKKVLPILVDSGSSHTFLNAAMIPRISVTSVLAKPLKVKVANGQCISSEAKVRDLQWWIQGCTFSTTARILEFGAYDLILGMDLLEVHSPMQCD
jgi:hypothetical protein